MRNGESNKAHEFLNEGIIGKGSGKLKGGKNNSKDESGVVSGVPRAGRELLWFCPVKKSHLNQLL